MSTRRVMQLSPRLCLQLSETRQESMMDVFLFFFSAEGFYLEQIAKAACFVICKACLRNVARAPPPFFFLPRVQRDDIWLLRVSPSRFFCNAGTQLRLLAISKSPCNCSSALCQNCSLNNKFNHAFSHTNGALSKRAGSLHPYSTNTHKKISLGCL